MSTAYNFSLDSQHTGMSNGEIGVSDLSVPDRERRASLQGGARRGEKAARDETT